MGKLLYRCGVHKGKKHPEWSYDAVIYEMNTRQFTPEGTFRAAAGHIGRLRELGVDIIWIMPVFPIGEERRKGTLGSYYSVRDYTTVNPEFGTADDFRDFVGQVHQAGMKIIMDWVPNHTSRDAVWTAEHPDWYEYDPATGEIATPFDWSDTAKLDYANPEMRQAMVEALKMWLQDYSTDGFRMDMAMLVPTSFWNEATPQLEQVRPDLFMLAEAEDPQLHDRAFDATYNWEVHHMMNDIPAGKAGAGTLRGKLTELSVLFPEHAFRMNFTSNHDENTWNGTESMRMGAADAQMAALSFVLPGIPMVYNGQEIGSQKQLPFFEKDHIEWNVADERRTDLYRELCRLRHTHPALAGGERGGDLYSIDNNDPTRIFSVKRKIGEHIVVGLFNFSGSDADVEFYDDDFEGVFNQTGSRAAADLKNGARFWLGPWGFFVYYR